MGYFIKHTFKINGFQKKKQYDIMELNYLGEKLDTKRKNIKNQNIAIIIPSYNESANITILVKKITLSLPRAYILIIDDSNLEENSKLQAILKGSSKETIGRVKIISRFKKLGRGSAVLLGFKGMLGNKSILYFFEMDADLAHDPQDFAKFLDAVQVTNADIVIGSRYLSNSKITKWPLWRLVLSRLINFSISLWLDLKLSDYTNGFRLYNRKAVEFLTTIHLREKGFISLSEIAFRLKGNKFKIVEIPISFTDRKHGKSSANGREFMSALIGLIRIRVVPMKIKT